VVQLREVRPSRVRKGKTHVEPHCEWSPVAPVPSAAGVWHSRAEAWLCGPDRPAGCAWMQSATALAGWACTKMKTHPVGELRLLGKSRGLNELCVCAALNCRF